MDRDSKIAALSNPYSGRNKRGGLVKFEHVISKYPAIKHLIVSQPNEIAASLKEFAQQKVEIIILNCGDGTLQAVLTYLKHLQKDKFSPQLLLLRAGTTSMAFGDVGCKGDLDKILKRVTQYADGNMQKLRSVQRPILRMHLPKSNITLCGMFFGAGAIYSGILYCRQKLHTKGVRGEIGPSIAMLWFLLDWMTVNKLAVPARATIDINANNLVKGEFNIIAATTMQRLLMGVFPFWGGEAKNCGLSFTSIKSNPPNVIRALINILRGRAPKVEVQPEYYHSYCPKTLIIEIENGFTLDGELFGEEGVNTKIILDTAGTANFLVV